MNRESMCTWPKRWLRIEVETTWMLGEWQRWDQRHKYAQTCLQSLCYKLSKSQAVFVNEYILLCGLCNPGVWDCDEGVGQECTFSTAPELPSGSPASGNVEEVHPVGKKQPIAHRRPDPHHKKRWLVVVGICLWVIICKSTIYASKG